MSVLQSRSLKVPAKVEDPEVLRKLAALFAQASQRRQDLILAEKFRQEQKNES